MKVTNFRILYSLIPALIVIITGTAAFNNLNSVKNSPHAMLERVAAPKGPGYLPTDWMDRQRTFPYATIKPEVYLEAYRQAAAMNATAERGSFNWELAGPLNVGGRITDIEIPTGSTSTIYIGAASGGIFKTVNNGMSWTNIFDQASSLTIGDLAIDTENPELMYAGTGEANSSSQSFRGDGIYKSTDGGNSWQYSGLDQSAYIGRIVIDHSDSERVFAAACGNLFTPDSNRGVYRTTDGGATWEQVLFISDSTSAIDLVQHPTNPDILYAAMWERMRGLNYRRSFGETSGIWMTTDGGANWSELDSGLPQGSETGRIGLAISPSSPSVLYAFYDNQYEVAVYKTINGGQNWTRTNDNTLQGMNSSFGWYFGQIRVNPENPDRVYVLGVYMYTTSNGGNSWSETGYEMHVDHHALAFHPTTGRMYEGNDGGLYFSDNGNSWSKINNLPLTQFYDIEVDYLNPERIYGGTQDNNTVRTTTGQLSDWEAILGGDGFYCLVDYTNSNTIYAEYQWGALHKSTNGGSWMESINSYWSSDRVNWSAPVIMHPQQNNTLYFGTYRVWKSTNAGNSWVAVSNDLTNGDDGSTYHTITTLAISSIEPDIVLAGSDDGRVHISTNGGSIWSDISDGLPQRWITRVAADPFDVNTIYVSLSGFRWDEPLAHVYKSVDLGQTWQPISGNLPELPVNALIADPTKQGRLFIGNDAGVYMSENGGEEWLSLNTGLGNVPVTTMKIHADENFLLIGTYGLSAYKLDLSGLNVGVQENKPVNPTLSVAGVYPVPFNPSAGNALNFRIASGVAGASEITISDISGRQLFTETNFRLSQGFNTYSWNGKEISGKEIKAGIYFLNVKSAGVKASVKFLVL